MHDTDTSPLQKIKEKEERAEKIISEADEGARIVYARLVKQKEDELDRKTEDVLRQSEEHLQNLRSELDSKTKEAESRFAAKAEKIKQDSRDKVDVAADLIVEQLLNTK